MVRKRKTEVDFQPGAITERATGLGIPVPYHRAIIRMIHELEDGTRRMRWSNLDELAIAGQQG